MSNVPVLETERLVLRAHREEDFDAMAAMWADPAVVRYISGEEYTPEETWTWFLRYAGHWSVRGYGYWAITAREDSRFMGETGFADYRREITPALNGRPEAGWVLRSEEFGQGYATEAVKAVTAWADANIEIATTVCLFDPEHAASIRVAEKVGYRKLRVSEYRGSETLVMTRPRRWPGAGPLAGK
ncbi:GNAT family N-acetyltransferase [Amaricoccus tamworthensis]|uniref:GNAT family N-acetyltransferase n=1 Tax=Amaricoccus tamworthensis TaxID=57002 RepID=UPI003C7BE147